MKETTRQKLKYAEDTDAPNYPTQGKELAEGADAALNRAGAQARKVELPGGKTRTNTGYGLLEESGGLTDKLAALTIVTGALLFVVYRATWQSSVGGAGRAAIMLSKEGAEAKQLKVFSPAELAYVVEAAASPITAAHTGQLYTTGFGLVTAEGFGMTGAPAVPTTGAALAPGPPQPSGSEQEYAYEVNGATTRRRENLGGAPGLLVIENLAAGAYDLSVQFKSSSGSVTVEKRFLAAWTGEPA